MVDALGVLPIFGKRALVRPILGIDLAKNVFRIHGVAAICEDATRPEMRVVPNKSVE